MLSSLNGLGRCSLTVVSIGTLTTALRLDLDPRRPRRSLPTEAQGPANLRPWRNCGGTPRYAPEESKHPVAVSCRLSVSALASWPSCGCPAVGLCSRSGDRRTIGPRRVFRVAHTSCDRGGRPLYPETVVLTWRNVATRSRIGFPHSFPRATESVLGRRSDLTPISVMPKEPRTIGQPSRDRSP
jgi:hypothetical protein